MLEVTDLQSFYGSAHVIQGASLTVREKEAVRCSAATAWARRR